MSNRSRPGTPPERPSWGFASAREATQLEGEYLNGEDSDDSELGASAGHYGFDRSDASRRSRLFNDRSREGSPRRGRSTSR